MADTAQASDPTVVRFLIEEGPLAGQEFRFHQYELFVVGRAKDNHLCLPGDRKVSRYHCRFEIQPPECRLVDLASRNGTYRNEEPVQTEMLKDGDRIRISDTVIRVVIPSPGNHKSGTKPTIAWSASDGDSGGAPSENSSRGLIAGYRLDAQIGQGGMGQVYRATHAKTDKIAAVKIIRPEDVPDSGALERFLREVSILSGLRHKRIVELYEFGISDKRPYLIMEHISTIDFLEILQTQDRSHRIRLACGMTCRILEALRYAHENDVVHRDVKPANVLVYREGRKLKAKLADFGLAKNYLVAGLSSLSCDEDKKGTLAFMAMEQFIDCRYTKPSSDIFSTGACLYYYLTGCTVFDFQDSAEAVAAILNGIPTPILQRDSTLPAELAAVIDRSVAREATDRFSSAKLMREALLPFTRRNQKPS